MDLIYTDINGKDIGVLEAVSFDLAYGVDENNFEISIPKNKHCCEAGSLIYIEGTEYGGIVDAIEVNSSDDMLKYTGRTFHGILNSKIIQPPLGYDYLTLYGDANEVIAQLIDLLDLSELFAADTRPSGIKITAYSMERYIAGYDGIRKMLNSVSAKLKIEWNGRRAILSAYPLMDYSVSEEFLLNAVSDMSVKKKYNPVNHIIGLGTGDLSKRKVIHIFTDANGGVMPFATSDNPVKDSDYILDNRNQKLFGKLEVCEIYELSNAQTVENFVLTASQPKDWAKNFSDYYISEKDGSYKQTTVDGQNTYTLQSSKPSDWNDGFSNYYVKEGTEYKSVQGSESENYTLLSAQPVDWMNNYSDYYFSSGQSYIAVEGITNISYRKQTERPLDWSTNYNSYYVKDKNGNFASVSSPRVWTANQFYTQYVSQVAPVWTNTYYKKNVVTTAPAWKSNTYYSQSTKSIRPPWKRNTYYKRYTDSYKSIVSGCVEKLEAAWNSDSVDITLNPSQNYDIGDIVGCVDNITGVYAVRQITKKIVKLDSYGNYEISYEEGKGI